MAQSGAPLDLLFRLGVQSVNGLPNGATSGGEAREASGGFQALMRAMREAQAAGAVSLRFERHPNAGRVFLRLDGDDSRAAAAARQVRQFLGVGPEARDFEVVYGAAAAARAGSRC